MEFYRMCRSNISNDRDVYRAHVNERKNARALVALVFTKAFPFIERIKSVLRAICQDPFL